MEDKKKLDQLEQDLKEIHPFCFNWAMSCVHWKEELAEEILQESYYKAIKNYHQFQPGTSLKAWIFTIIRNTAIDYFRKSGEFLEYQDEVSYKEVDYFQTATQERRFKEKKEAKITFE